MGEVIQQSLTISPLDNSDWRFINGASDFLLRFLIEAAAFLYPELQLPNTQRCNAEPQ